MYFCLASSTDLSSSSTSSVAPSVAAVCADCPGPLPINGLSVAPASRVLRRACNLTSSSLYSLNSAVSLAISCSSAISVAFCEALSRASIASAFALINAALFSSALSTSGSSFFKSDAATPNATKPAVSNATTPMTIPTGPAAAPNTVPNSAMATATAVPAAATVNKVAAKIPNTPIHFWVSGLLFSIDDRKPSIAVVIFWTAGKSVVPITACTLPNVSARFSSALPAVSPAGVIFWSSAMRSGINIAAACAP